MLEDKPALNKTDEELVVLILKDKKYYIYLLNRYEEKLMRYVRRITGAGADDVKDILQEVFIKVYTNLNEFDSHLKFSSWIYRIAHNEAVTFLRKNKNKSMMVNFELDKVLIRTSRADLDIKKEIDQKDFLENIQKIINGLENKDYREALILRYIEDKDYREISDILKKPMGTVATLLNRAKKQLKNELLKNRQFNAK